MFLSPSRPEEVASLPREGDGKAMFNITIRVSGARSFDGASIARATDAGTIEALKKIGAFVRKTARQSMKTPSKKAREAARAGKVSPISTQGKPPLAHTENIKRFMLFDVDRVRKTVSIGPKQLSRTVTNKALKALEFGGSSVGKSPRTHKTRRINVKARPFMGPALEANESKFAGIFAEFLP